MAGAPVASTTMAGAPTAATGVPTGADEHRGGEREPRSPHGQRIRKGEPGP